MCYLKKYVFLALLLFFCIDVRAQQPANVISLRQLLLTVDQKAPALLTDSAAILIRQAQATETRSNWLPNLKLNYQADIGSSNNVNGPYFGFGIIPSSSGGIHNTNNTSAEGVNLG
jgi:outer membrane protein TolC